MLEIEEAAIENHGAYCLMMVKVAKLSDDSPDEWRVVAKHYGRGSVRVYFPEAWREGEAVDLDE